MFVLLAVSPLAGKLFELRADWPAILCVLAATLLVVPEQSRAPVSPEARWSPPAC